MIILHHSHSVKYDNEAFVGTLRIGPPIWESLACILLDQSVNCPNCLIIENDFP
jgi:hypothetical protein